MREYVYSSDGASGKLDRMAVPMLKSISLGNKRASCFGSPLCSGCKQVAPEFELRLKPPSVGNLRLLVLPSLCNHSVNICLNELNPGMKCTRFYKNWSKGGVDTS